jgi:hypothetical protein
MSNHRFVVFLAVIVGLGVATGYWLATLPKLESYQLLNVAGLLYTFLAVVVLSEIATSNARWKKISVETVTPVVLWLHTVFPLGVSLGGVLAVALHSSSWAVPRFAFSFFVYSIIPLSVLNETVVFPRFAAVKGLESRWRWFGLYLLLNGVGLQLIAALLGLRS